VSRDEGLSPELAALGSEVIAHRRPPSENHHHKVKLSYFELFKSIIEFI
jgi:hypothetical protein